MQIMAQHLENVQNMLPSLSCHMADMGKDDIFLGMSVVFGSSVYIVSQPR